MWSDIHVRLVCVEYTHQAGLNFPSLRDYMGWRTNLCTTNLSSLFLLDKMKQTDTFEHTTLITLVTTTVGEIFFSPSFNLRMELNSLHLTYTELMVVLDFSYHLWFANANDCLCTVLNHGDWIFLYDCKSLDKCVYLVHHLLIILYRFFRQTPCYRFCANGLVKSFNPVIESFLGSSGWLLSVWSRRGLHTVLGISWRPVKMGGQPSLWSRNITPSGHRVFLVFHLLKSCLTSSQVLSAGIVSVGQGGEGVWWWLLKVLCLERVRAVKVGLSNLQ